jgi:hypothetical protein
MRLERNACGEEERKKVFVVRPVGKKPVGIHGRSLEDSNKMGLREI